VIRFVAGIGVGYVLGSRAGRERYEQIKRWSRRVADNPAVQGAAGLVRAQVTNLVRQVTHKD
jgi:hypothetical protein